MQTSFLRRKLRAAAAAALVFSLAVSATHLLLLSAGNQNQIINQAQAATTTLNLPNLKGIDVMKYTKDTMTGQPTDADIQNLVNTLATMNVTHVSLSLPMDPSSDYPSGSKPAPRDAYVLTQKWADTIHQKGLKIVWRGTWSGIEGIYGFPKRTGSNRFPAGTAASAPTDGTSTWLGKTYQYIVSNPNFFAAGDIWAPLPERTEGIFSDSTSFIPSDGAGLQANYVNFMNDLKYTSEAALAKIGKTGVVTGMTANNYSEVMSTWLPQNFFDVQGVIAIDYYGINHTPQEVESDMRKMYAMRGKPIFLQEWGDYWNVNLSQADRTNYLNQIYAVLQKLANEGILAGFNYWGGWDNSAEGVLTKTSSGYGLNYRGQILSNFFAANNPTQTVPVANNPPATTTPPPTTTAPAATSCPAPAVNAFTGCYYSAQNLNSPVLTRTDASINFDWGGGSPDAKISPDQFFAKWEGSFNFNGGDYTFTATADDGVKLYVDGELLINQWKDQPATTYKATKTLSAGAHSVRLDYYEAFGGAVAKLSWSQNSTSVTPPPTTTAPTAPAPAGFTASYYRGTNFSQLILSRSEQSVNYAWNSGSPDPIVPSDLFSARWVGSFSFPAGTRTFSVTADDGVRLYIDNQLVIDRWKDQAATTYSVSKYLSAGTHTIRMDYYEAYGGAVAKLSWR